MNDGLSIRQPAPDEIQALSEFAVRVYFESYNGGPDIDDQELLTYAQRIFEPDQFRAEFAHPDSQFFVATANKVMVGFAKVVLGAENTGVMGTRPVFLSRLYTSANVHGTGVGQALLTRCIEVSHRASCDVMWLTVWECSLRAIHFYQKNGFSKIGEVPFLLGQRSYTDLLMEKPLLTA